MIVFNKNNKSDQLLYWDVTEEGACQQANTEDGLIIKWL